MHDDMILLSVPSSDCLLLLQAIAVTVDVCRDWSIYHSDSKYCWHCI